MSKILIILLSIFLVGCSNWKYKDVEYERCVYLESIHVHFYRHETCEWSCLNMDEGLYTFTDSFRVKYKTNKEGEVKRIKLIK
jgi:hypothetical protein